jgi:hypothetical protein
MFGAVQSLLKYKVTRFVAASSQHVTVGNVSELAFDRTDAHSFSFWMRSDGNGASNQHIFSKEVQSPNNGYWVDLEADGDMAWGIGGITSPPTGPGRIRTHTSGVNFHDGLWHHWAGTYTGSGVASGITHYHNGAAIAHVVDQDNSTDSILNTVPFSIGSRQNGLDLFCNADLQDFCAFDRVIMAGEVADLHRRSCPPDVLDLGFGASLVGYWILGEHKGDVGGVAAGITSGATVPDLSASGNDGTMINGPAVVTRL